MKYYQSAKAITDKALLKNLFLYPSLIKEFSSSIKDFDKLAVSKTTAFAKYCRILEVQSIKFSELNMQGNVKVYLNFQIHDAWLADIEGTLANLKTCPAK